MSELRIVALNHDFGPRGSDDVELFVADCGNCEKQCGFTGLYVREAVIDSTNKTLVAGEASTSLYQADTVETLKDASEPGTISRHTLVLGSIEGEVSLDDLTNYTLETVSRYLEAGNCLVDLAQRQAETPVL